LILLCLSVDARGLKDQRRLKRNNEKQNPHAYDSSVDPIR